MIENTKIINLTKHKTPQYITNFWWHKYNHNSAVAEMGDRLATVDMGRKEGVAVPLSVHGSPSNNVARAEVYLPTKWHLDPSSRLARTDMDQKWGCCAPFGGSGSPPNTVWHGPRPTSVLSGILIHPTVLIKCFLLRRHFLTNL